MVAHPSPLTHKLELARARAVERRCQAFVPGCVWVLGLRLGPVTLGTYNALLAWRNAFVTGHAPRVSDVCHFIWLHHPDYNPGNPWAEQQMIRLVRRRLRAFAQPLRDRVLGRWPGCRTTRRILGHTEREKHQAAADAIRGALDDALWDFPRGDAAAEPLPFSLQAYFLSHLKREIGLSFDEAERMPLGRVVQHLRQIIHRNSRGNAMLMTPEEARILAEDLRIRTEEASKPEAMAREQETIRANAERRMRELS